MSATPVSSAPLSQAMARRKSGLLPLLLLGLGIVVALGFATAGYLESRRTERVVVFVRDVPFGQQIAAEDLGTVELPLHRPAQLQGLADPAAVVGQYAARDLGADDLAQPGMLMAEPPDQPVYPNGQQLTANMVPVPFATTTIGPLTHRDRVNVGFNDSQGAPDLCDQARSAAAGREPSVEAPSTTARPRAFACRLLSDLRVLFVDEAAGVAYLELTPYQAHTVWALQAAGLQLWGERYGASSDLLPALDRLDIGQVSAEELTAPVPTPQPAAPAEPGAGTPGAGSPIPGARP
jgi:hypothetical protein